MAWLGLVADFTDDRESADRRGHVRRTLRIESVLKGARDPSKVAVLNLSEAGMMLHTAEDLAVGETIAIELPEAGIVEARVVWKRVSLLGCEFTVPVTRGAISAALLKADPEPQLSAKSSRKSRR